MVKEIGISGGYTVLVDDEDYDIVSLHKWKKLRSRQRIYAARTTGKDKCTTVLLHRFLMKAKRGEYVDHRNGNTLDNRRDNLRITNNSGNLANRSKQANNTTGFKGVYFNKSTKLGQAYTSTITKDYVIYFLVNYSKDPVECAKAYDRAALHFYGDFSQLNFPLLKNQYLEENKNIDYSKFKKKFKKDMYDRWVLGKKGISNVPAKVC